MCTKAGEHGTRILPVMLLTAVDLTAKRNLDAPVTAHSGCHRNTFPFERSVKAFLSLPSLFTCRFLFYFVLSYFLITHHLYIWREKVLKIYNLDLIKNYSHTLSVKAYTSVLCKIRRILLHFARVFLFAAILR